MNTKSVFSTCASVSALVMLVGCASVPKGPSVMVMPGSGKSFEQFRADDADCRQYAQSQSGDASQASVDAGVRSAALGTVVGDLAGAAIGGHQGAGAGAGTGLLVGSMAGAGAAQSSANGTQRQYDNAYVQCMYAKGEQVPVAGALKSERRTRRIVVSPSTTYYPPPPPGYAPAPSGYVSQPPPPPGYAPPPPPQ